MIAKEKFYNGIRTGYPYVARHLGWYVNNFSQEDYYAAGVSRFSTSLNDKAMDGFRRSVIGRLSMRRGMNLYWVMKSICSRDYMNAYASWPTLLKSISYLLLKKIAVQLGLR